jgi:hypothetical protein
LEPNSDDALVWTIRTTCEKLGGLHRMTIWRYIKEGKLQTSWIGGRHMVLVGSVKALIAKGIPKEDAPIVPVASDEETELAEPPVKVKRKRGRPRKPRPSDNEFKITPATL